MKIIEIERTKKGFPALWESGGGYTNTGEAIIITGKNGEAKQPIYIRRKGQLACCRHALIPVDVGYYIISAKHHRRNFEISVYRITEILKEDASIERVAWFSIGEWDTVPFVSLEASIQAAMKKATCYHCREPHYIRE